MLNRRHKLSLILFILACIYPALSRAADSLPEEVVTVAKPSDNSPFTYRIALASRSDSFQVYRLSYPSPVRTAIEPNNTVPAELYMPRGIAPGDPKRPAVICLHILDGNVELVKIACSILAARGIPAAWFNLPFYGPRSPTTGKKHIAASDPVLFTTAMSQAVEDVRRTVDVLASRPEIDARRIGVMGISLGGILATTAAENDPRIDRVVAILAGGDLLPVLRRANEAGEIRALLGRLPSGKRAEIEHAIEESDPLTHADRLRARAEAGKVLMVNAARDEVIPRLCTEKLAAALGIANRVRWLDGLGHYTAMAALPETLQAMTDFFAQDLPPGVTPPSAAAGIRSPQRTLAELIRQLADLLTAEPKEGCCHLADLEVAAVGKDGKKIEGRIRLVRGPKPKFTLYCRLPGIGEASLGCGTCPWMTAGQRVVFLGRGAGVPPAASVARGSRLLLRKPAKTPAPPIPFLTPIRVSS